MESDELLQNGRRAPTGGGGGDDDDDDNRWIRRGASLSRLSFLTSSSWGGRGESGHNGGALGYNTGGGADFGNDDSRAGGGPLDGGGGRGAGPTRQGMPHSLSSYGLSDGRVSTTMATTTTGGGGGRGLGKALSFTIPLVMPGNSGVPRAKPASGAVVGRQPFSDEASWDAEEIAIADVATAISRDLVTKAERWKLLAEEPLMAQSITPLLADNVDKHEVAAIYVRDALAGRDSSACIHNERSIRALKWFRNNAWNSLLNVCTLVHLILPMVEIQKCLSCMSPHRRSASLEDNTLFLGWRPTSLGSLWIECALCVFYTCHLRQEALSRLGSIPVGNGDGGGGVGGGWSGVEGEEDEEGLERDRPQAEVYSLSALRPWQLARTCMVTVLSVSIVAKLFSHYVFGVTWFSWRHVILPFLFISRRTYLKHFLAATIRLLPRMVPVVFLIFFITFFYGFIGYIVYRDEPHGSSLLSDLDLFDQPASSALTFLRIFTARSFMLDVEEIYGGRPDVELMVLSYGVIMFIFLLALVPAVATHNFNSQSKKSYYWVKEQRKLALTRAFMLLRHRDGNLPRDDYVQLMMCLRPDCDKDHTSALFSAAKRAEEQQSNSISTVEGDRNLLSKTGFFMLCALGTADISRTQNERMKMYRRSRRRRSGRTWARARARLDAALSWSWPGSNLPLSQQVLNVALLIQGYQIVRAGDNPEGRPAWAYPLGAVLIFYFCLQAALRMIAGGVRPYFLEWRNILEMSLNMVGIAYYAQLWPRGQAFHSFYQILQALRLELLWINLHLLGPTSSDVATRLEFVFPAVIRASFVLFALTYTYAVVAYAMYCSTPLGAEAIGDLKDDSMVKRFAAVKEVANFATLPRSFASMMYIVMFSNWPMFMDAAGVVGNLVVAKVFFYSFKAIGFYFVMPVLLGFIVTSYMNAHVPSVEDLPKQPPAARKLLPPREASSSSSPLIGSNGTPPNRGAGGGRGGVPAEEEKASPLVRFRKSLQRRSSFGDEPTRSNRGKFGYSTLADGAHTEIDVAALAVPRGSQEGLAELGQGEGDYDEVEDEGPSAEGRDRENLEDENSGGCDDDDEVEDDVATELWDAGKRREKERAYSDDSSTEEDDHHAPNMAMLPDDSTLTVAIKDATVSTSTVNPARITSAVQKMRPDWCVNKRRVKRLLRSMNNDAWKAAVNTTVNAGNPSARGSSSTATASEPSSAEAPAASVAAAAETATTRSSIRAAAKAAKAAKAAEKALKLADKAAAKAADKAAVAAAKAAAESAATSPSAGSAAGACETAPASPGSPAGPTTAAAAAATAVGSSAAPLLSPAETVGSSKPGADYSATTGAGAAAAAAAAGGAPWDEGGVVAPGGGGEEPLSESLDLATDLELEPGVDLKADLGIVTNAPAAAASASAAVTEVEDGGILGAGASAVGDSGRAEAADNLGFEMIDKAEVVGSGAGTSANGKARKPWPWAWTRSS